MPVLPSSSAHGLLKFIVCKVEALPVGAGIGAVGKEVMVCFRTSSVGLLYGGGKPAFGDTRNNASMANCARHCRYENMVYRSSNGIQGVLVAPVEGLGVVRQKGGSTGCDSLLVQLSPCLIMKQFQSEFIYGLAPCLGGCTSQWASYNDRAVVRFDRVKFCGVCGVIQRCAWRGGSVGSVRACPQDMINDGRPRAWACGRESVAHTCGPGMC